VTTKHHLRNGGGSGEQRGSEIKTRRGKQNGKGLGEGKDDAGEGRNRWTHHITACAQARRNASKEKKKAQQELGGKKYESRVTRLAAFPSGRQVPANLWKKGETSRGGGGGGKKEDFQR